VAGESLPVVGLGSAWVASTSARAAERKARSASSATARIGRLAAALSDGFAAREVQCAAQARGAVTRAAVVHVGAGSLLRKGRLRASAVRDLLGARRVLLATTTPAGCSGSCRSISLGDRLTGCHFRKGPGVSSWSLRRGPGGMCLLIPADTCGFYGGARAVRPFAYDQGSCVASFENGEAN
jgi:hypothetical protein